MRARSAISRAGSVTWPIGREMASAAFASYTTSIASRSSARYAWARSMKRFFPDYQSARALFGLAVIVLQVVGALLVLALMITPAAAAMRITASPVRATVLAVVFAEVAAVGGILLSLQPGLPVSALVTAVSFVIYLVCRGVGAVRSRAV